MIRNTKWLPSALFLSGLLLLSLLAMASRVNAADVLDKVKSQGELIVGMEGTYPPFNYIGDDGKLTGFEVDFTDELAKHLGVKPVIRPTKWDGILAALSSGRIEAVINQVAITDARKKTFDFSEGYTRSGIQALVRKQDANSILRPEDLVGKKVGVGLGTNYEQWVRSHVPGADVRTYDDDPSKYQDLIAGRIDTILVDRLAALDFVKKTGGTLVLSGKPLSFNDEVGIAVRKGNPQFLAALNNAIEQMRQDGSLRRISEKWFGEDVSQ